MMGLTQLIILIPLIADFIHCNKPPVFLQSIDLSVIKENTPIGTSVLQLEGVDPENSSVAYGIEGTELLSVNRETGVITVAGTIDREKTDSLKFFVTLEDIVGGQEANNLVRMPITVIIIDENDNPPVFQNELYRVTVKEDTAPGMTVLKDIIVTDDDDVGGVLQLRCKSVPEGSGACEKISISTESTGSRKMTSSLVLRKQLSYAERHTHNLTLIATDGYYNSTSVAMVYVEDVQNLPPVFIGSSTGIVDEDAPIGTLIMKVIAKDGDEGYKRRITYKLVSNPEGFFSINSKSGELRTAKPLDREIFSSVNGVINVAVKAMETLDDETLPSGKPEEWSSTMVLSITIRDVNDEAPAFNKVSYTVQINENVVDGTPLPNLDMFLEDPDMGSNSVFNIELYDESGIFSIEPALATRSTSVSIRVANGPLDYENPNQRKFILLVIAKEAFTKPQLSSTGTVTVVVSDINDNAPEFKSSMYKATVLETAPSGTVVETIIATDRDTGLFGEAGIRYSLFGNGAERFHVGSETGVITVSSCSTPGSSNCLDYETRSAYYLSYQAIDEMLHGHAAVVPLTIMLSDDNDNAPSFLQDIYFASIDEGSTTFDLPVRVQAVDADASSVLHYSIIAGDDQKVFSMDGRLGEISVANPDGLDVSTLKSNMIRLTVQASDGPRGNVTASVEITVKDANNNRPKFEKDNYQAIISESAAPGTVVEQVLARDDDTGVNAEISYRILKGGFDDFTIDEKNGIVTVQKQTKLNFDRRNEYNLVIIAADGGVPSFTGTASLTISILNSNDKAPYFTPSTQRAQVFEGEVVGHAFYKLLATDPDINSQDSLSFAMSHPASAIDKDGKVLPNMSYAMYQEFFDISPSTGEVKVASRLDREVAAIVTLKVLVVDNSAMPPQTGTGSLVVTIVDMNDYPPAFAHPWTPQHPEMTLHIIEEQPMGSVVASLLATDKDSNIAKYEIVPENPYFAIGNDSGVITVKSRIDYEAIHHIIFTVVAYDTGIPQLSSSAVIRANVININDNNPTFNQSSYHTTLKENAPQGTLVSQVNAQDLDADEFGWIQYYLLGEKKDDFYVDQEGVIRVAAAATLDHEVTPSITLQVVAADQGADLSTRRSTSVPVYISLEDVNDNPPVFNQREYEGTYVSGLPLSPPTTIVQVFADDADSGTNAEVIYKISSGNEKDTFSMNPQTGVVFPVKEVEIGVKSFSLRVQASNKDDVARDEAVVHIKVIEINRYKPKFMVPASPNTSVEIIENLGIDNALVLTVFAEDKDKGENGRVSYFLKIAGKNVAESDEFKINSVTGEVRTKKSLDREQASHYQLVLVARDNGSPTAFETLSFLSIVLKDIDDNNPEFPRLQITNPYIFTLEENLPKNSIIGHVSAEDRDERENAMIYYYIIDGNYGAPFYVEKTTGLIKSNTSFDREEKASYEIVIKASSDPDFTVYEVAEEPGLTAMQRSYHEEDLSLALIRILIADVNDNPPKFLNEPYHRGIKKSTQPGDVVLTLTAVDFDDEKNGAFEYLIENVRLFRPGSTGSVRPVPSPFNITAAGHLVATQLMARYDHSRFMISIAARESAEPFHVTRTTVKLWVYEDNQLVRVIVSQPPEEINKHIKSAYKVLSNATRGTVVIDDIQYHVNEKKSLTKEWTDLFVHVVNEQDEIMLVSQILESVDSNLDLLKIHQGDLKIHKIVPAHVDLLGEELDLSLVALTCLLVVLFVGIITMSVCCICLKKWYSTKVQEVLVHHSDNGNAGNMTENPLWTEQKLKLYEEQELSMTVSPDHPSENRQRQLLPEISPVDQSFDAESVMYATLQKSSAGSCMGTFRQQTQKDEFNEYATLSGCYSRVEAESANDDERNLLPSATDLENHEYHELHCQQESSENTSAGLVVNSKGEPVLVTELL